MRVNRKHIRNKFIIYNYIKNGLSQKEIMSKLLTSKQNVSYTTKEFKILGIIEDNNPELNKYKKYSVLMDIKSFYDFNQLYPKKKTHILKHQFPLDELIKLNRQRKSNNRGKKHHTETIQYFKDWRSTHHISKKDTLPERLFALLLDVNRIEYEKQKRMTGNPDFFIEPNICIFIDGCYWHFCQDDKCRQGIKQKLLLPSDKQLMKIKRDLIVNHELPKDGYFVIRIWEHDIVNNAEDCSSRILKLIKSQKYLQVKQ